MQNRVYVPSNYSVTVDTLAEMCRVTVARVDGWVVLGQVPMPAIAAGQLLWTKAEACDIVQNGPWMPGTFATAPTLGRGRPGRKRVGRGRPGRSQAAADATTPKGGFK